MMMPRAAALFLLLVASPAQVAADLPRARSYADQQRWGQARAELTPALASSDPSQRFEAEVLLAFSHYFELETPMAYAKLRALQARPRHQLSPRALRAFCLLSAELEGSPLSPELRERGLKEALKWSQTADERVEVLLKLTEFKRVQNRTDEALEHLSQAGREVVDGSCTAQRLGELSLRRAVLDRDLGRAGEAELDLANARRWFEAAGDAAGQCRTLRLRAGLSSDAGIARQMLWRALAGLRDPRLSAERLEVLRALKQRAEPDVKRLIAQLRRAEAEAATLRQRLVFFKMRLDTSWGSRAELDSCLRQLRAWLRTPPAGFEDETRLFCHYLLAVSISGTAAEEALVHFQAALQLAEKVRPHPRDELLARCSVPALAGALSELHSYRGNLLQAQTLARRAVSEARTAEETDYRTRSQTALLGMHLRSGQLGEARNALRSIMAEAASSKVPSQRALLSFALFEGLLRSGTAGTSALFPGALRVPPGTPAAWMLEEVSRDPALQETILTNLRTWLEIERTRKDVRASGGAAMIYAVTLAFLGRTEDALDVYRQALDTSKGEPNLQANVSFLLSRELYAQNRMPEAVKYMSDAAEAGLKGAGEWTSFYTMMLGSLLLESGDLPRALEVTDRSIQMRREEPGYGLPISQILRARILSRLGRSAEGAQAAQLALAAVGRLPHPDIEAEAHQVMADLEPQRRAEHLWLAWRAKNGPGRISGLGEFVLQLADQMEHHGHLEDACKLCVEALETLASRREGLPAESRQRFAQFSHAQPLLERAVKLSLQLNQPQQASRLLGLAVALEEVHAVTPSTLRADSAPRAQLQQLDDLRAQLTGLHEMLARSEARNKKGLQARLTSTRSEFLTTLNRLRRENPQFDDTVAAQGSELLALQPRLEPGTLVLQYYATGGSLYIQAVTREGLRLQPVRVEATRLRQLAQSWRAALSRPVALSEAQLQVGRDLHNLLLSPVAPLTASASHILILPSADLWSVPFETLPDEHGRYLVEQCAVSYLASADLLLLGNPVQRAPGKLVAIGNPVLEGTVSEVESLRPLFPDGLVLPAGAARQQLLAASRGAAYLHIASHSAVRAADPNASFLELGDGALTLADVYNLELPQGALVVLSSCESGVGQAHAGRELVALSTGFRAAGAASVVSSLWEVDDRLTARLFPAMYARLLQGDTRSQSLRAAKLELLAKSETRHPYFWGGWTLLGDPR